MKSSVLPNSLLRSAGLVSLLAAMISGANAQPPANVQLPAAAKGAAAISALGSHLPAVARAYGLDPQKLTTLFQIQPSLGVDRGGALLFACGSLAVSKNSAVSGALSVNSSISKIASGSAVDAFLLHSFPGATRVIYLDFTGHTTSGTLWNSNMTGGATISSQAFDLDGSPGTFDANERALIQKIWERVAEDFAPFAIDVTTQDPGVDGLRRNDSSDVSYGTRVVISPTNWYGSGGGIAYINSFGWNSDTPCFAFTEQLANGEKYIAEAVAHEVGHTLGLHHDGAAGTEYYGGQGNWAPIMGIGYYKNVTQFSKGEYSGASNTEDDFAIMTRNAPLAADDHGNALTTARQLVGPTIADGGTIETRTDVDVFRFDTGTGAIALSITSPSPETDLHMRVELLNSAGQLLFMNGASSMNAAFNPTLSAGTYYLRISGIGAGDASTTGYSNYGSVGNYIITGSLAATGAKQAPTAVATGNPTSGVAPLNVSFSPQGSFDSDGSIASYRWDFGNGASSPSPSPSYIYQNPGSYTAVLTVTDNDGLQSSAIVPVIVSATVIPTGNIAPTANASADVRSGSAPLVVNFSSTGSFDPDGTITSYAWNFGDGSSSVGPAPAKTYSEPGNYSARLTVTDNSGAVSSATVMISVAKRSKRRN